MFKPDDPLAPRDPVFDEAWQAQTLAMADTMVKAGYFSATDWAITLGAALKQADSNGDPDTPETYYVSALKALETLIANGTPIAAADMKNRKAAWETAYLATPHGQPVLLSAVKTDG